MDNILVVGAGALGCELLLGLIHSYSHSRYDGLKHIHIIDMDTIELSNLHRQSLFQNSDIGLAKAQVASRRLSTRYPHLSISYNVGRVEEMSLRRLASFQIIFSAVDSLTTRRWLNGTLQDIHDLGLAECILIDCGIEGLMGHVRIIDIRGRHASISGCLECNVDLFLHDDGTDGVGNLPLCTLAGQPRTIEHCIGWAVSIEWPRLHPSIEFNPSNTDQLKTIIELSMECAQRHHIEGVTEESVTNALKRITPAVITTASFVANWALKKTIDFVAKNDQNVPKHNFWFYNAAEGSFHLQALLLDPNPQCSQCVRISKNKKQ